MGSLSYYVGETENSSLGMGSVAGGSGSGSDAEESHWGGGQPGQQQQQSEAGQQGRGGGRRVGPWPGSFMSKVRGEGGRLGKEWGVRSGEVGGHERR